MELLTIKEEKDKHPFISAEEKFLELTNQLESHQNKRMDLSYNENFLDKEGRELIRRLLQAHIDIRGVGDVGKSIKGSDGIARNHKRIRTRLIKSIFGEVKVERVGYSKRGNESLFPADGNLNLAQNSYSHGLQKRISMEMIKSSFEEAIESIEQSTGMKIPKRQIEKIISETARDFDAFYEGRCMPKELQSTKALPLLVLTCDGKGVVMRQKDLRKATREKAEKSNHKLDKRLSKGEKKNSKRMATVASVYNIDRFQRTPEEVRGELAPMHKTKKVKKRPKPVAKRVWASLEKSPQDVIQIMFEEAAKRDTNREKVWVALVYGDLKQIKKLRVTARKYQVKLTIVCDIIHVLEYLWKASRVFHTESSPEAQNWVADRFLFILEGKSSYVAAGMRRSATKQGLRKAIRKPVDTCATYLLNHTQYLRYDHYLKEGFPIATGVIEGACRHLVNDRMDVTGARWGLKGAEAVLKLRSIKSSGDFQEYWSFHEKQEFYRNHMSKYADPSILKNLNNTA